MAAEILVCGTCGSNAARDAEGRTPGERLFALVRAACARVAAPEVTVTSSRCLWLCKSSCAVQLRSQGRVSYVLSELAPSEASASALVEYARSYASSPDGAVPYREWPEALRGHFVCRLPLLADPTERETP